MSLLENVENLSAQETSVAKTSARKAKKLIQLRPCKAMVVHAWKEHDPVVRIHFCTTCSNIDIINPMLCSKNVFVCFA